MRGFWPNACAPVALAVLVLPVPALDDPGLGFRLESVPYPGEIFAESLANGDIVTFDQKTVDRWSQSGQHVMTLATFDTCDPFIVPPTDCLWPGLFEIDPTETFLLFGETSFGDVWRIALDGSGKTFLANLPFNFDAAFEDGTHAIVSGATLGFGANQLTRLDTVTGAAELLADMQSWSGPVAVDSAGNVFYGSQQSGDVLVFFAAQVDSPPVTLTDADAFVFATGFGLASQMVTGVEPFRLFMAESDFFTGASRVWEVGSGPGSSRLLAEGPPFAAIGNLRFQPGTRDAVFAPFQPEIGGTLGYTSKDFVSFAERFELTPRRPAAQLSGPGLTGPGTLVLDLDGAHPFGIALLLWGPQPLYDPIETAYFPAPGAAPFITGMHPFTTQILPVFLFADSSGELSLPFFNDGSLTGLLALQYVIGDPFGSLLATSTAALN